MKTNWKSMEKRFLSFLMAFAMILSMVQAISPAVLANAAEETQSDTYPSVTEVDQYDNYDTFTISTAEEFVTFGTNVNAGYTYEGKTVLVTADLDFSGYATLDMVGSYGAGISGGNAGANNKPFKGHFDGQLHHFKNINMTMGACSALFAYTEAATIENIIFDEGTMSTTSVQVALLVFLARNSTIRNIENHVSVLTNSTASTANLGLVVNGVSTTFQAVVNYGNVGNAQTTSTQKQENGGIIAWGRNTCKIDSCYVAGEVYGTGSGKVGRGATITNSYYLTADDKGTISKADFASGKTAWNLNTLFGTQSNASIWFASENGPVLKATDTTSISNVDQYDNYNTFTISTAEEFVTFGTNVNAGYTYEGKTVLVTADLDFSDYATLDMVGSYGAGISGGNAGANNKPFKGHFDGQLHHFTNINMTMGGYSALFAYTEAATIENIIFDEGTLTTTGPQLSLLVFLARNSTIRNIENHVSVLAPASANAINLGIATNGVNTTFQAIVNYGNVGCAETTSTQKQENGGILGWGRNTCKIDSCYVAGEVYGTGSGKIGRGATITNSYYLTADDKGTISKADFASGKTAWNLNTLFGTQSNASIWFASENGPVLKATDTTSISNVDQYDNYDTFTVSTAEEFAALAANVSAGYTYEGKTVLVTADLDFSAYKDTYWTPIGTATSGNAGSGFKGCLDGQFHHFKNIDMKVKGHRQGLFGYMEGALIENIIFDEGTLTAEGARYSGVLCGTARNSTIRNIENHISIVDVSNYGYWNVGFVSHCTSTTFETIVNYGSIEGNAANVQENGGIASWGYNSCTFRSCYVAGTVTGTSSNMIARGAGTVNNCYYLTSDDTGTVSKADFISGKAAWNLNTMFGAQANAGLWSNTENGPVLNPDKATYTVKVSKFDVDGNALGEATYYCNQGDTFTLDTAGFKMPVCTLNGAALDGTSFTMPKGESAATIAEGLDISPIDVAIVSANAIKMDIQVIDGKAIDEVDSGIQFVTTDEMQALTDAIAAAEAAREAAMTVEDVTSAVAALNAAIDNFNSAIKVGSFTAVILMDGINYGSFENANAAYAGKPMKLLANIGTAETPVQLTQNIYVDLNGHNMYAYAEDGTDITVYGMDSTTDSYEAEKWGYLHVTGAAVAPITNNCYLAVDEADLGWSFHAFSVKLTHVSLKPDADALGYKAQFFGDAVVRSNVTGFGFNLWVSEDRIVTRGYEKAFENGQIVTLRLQNIMAADGGEMGINAEAFVTFSNDNTVKSTSYSTTMKQTLEAIETNLENDATAYSAEQIAAVQALISKFEDKMALWNIDTIQAWTPAE